MSEGDQRGHPLLLTQTPEKTTITVVNYCKWYDFHLVHPDGRVERLDDSYYAPFEKGELANRFPTLWADHVPAPGLMEAIAERNGWDYDWQAADMIQGRWERDIRRSGEHEPYDAAALALRPNKNLLTRLGHLICEGYEALQAAGVTPMTDEPHAKKFIHLLIDFQEDKTADVGQWLARMRHLGHLPTPWRESEGYKAMEGL